MSEPYNWRGFIIRTRERRRASPKEGYPQAWSEVQVISGRKVVARFDFEYQAENWIDKHLYA